MSIKALGWIVAAGLILWLFILRALVPWVTEQVSRALQVLP